MAGERTGLTTPRGDLWTANARISEYEGREAIGKYVAIAPDVPVILDAVYKDVDEEYLDVRALETGSF